MKHKLIAIRIVPFIALLFLAACSSPNSTNENPDSVSTAPANDSTPADDTDSGNQIICFQHLEGTSLQDTSYIQLQISNNVVKGIYNHLPYEKDSRKGTITGTIKNDIISGNWKYMQEGMDQSLPVKFKLLHDKLYQQKYSFNPATGTEELSDTAKFNIEYQKINCR